LSPRDLDQTGLLEPSLSLHETKQPIMANFPSKSTRVVASQSVGNSSENIERRIPTVVGQNSVIQAYTDNAFLGLGDRPTPLTYLLHSTRPQRRPLAPTTEHRKQGSGSDSRVYPE